MLITDSFEVKYILDYLGYSAPDDDDSIEFFLAVCGRSGR